MKCRYAAYGGKDNGFSIRYAGKKIVSGSGITPKLVMTFAEKRDLMNFSVFHGPVAETVCTEKNVESWLPMLIEHDCNPGTIIIDDKWQFNLTIPIPIQTRCRYARLDRALS